MEKKFFIVEFKKANDARVMRMAGDVCWFEEYGDAKLTGDDLCGELYVDYIICEKP